MVLSGDHWATVWLVHENEEGLAGAVASILMVRAELQAPLSSSESQTFACQ